MNIGMAETNITPPLGMAIPGYFHIREASGVKDELFAKAMVVESGSVTTAFIVLDLISIEQETSDNIRKRVRQYTGIPEENVMVSCTHTHTGPPRPLEPKAQLYYGVLESKAADAAVMAYEKRTAARIGFGRGEESGIAFNRRFYMKDGTVRTNPGILNPDIDKPEGPIDPEVVVIRLDDESGNPIGIASNYACHTDTVGGKEYSADFPGYISRTVKRLFGESTVSLFFQGACGNINHIDVSGRVDYRNSRHYQKMGELLGLEIAKVRDRIDALEPLPDAKLAVKSRFVEAGPRFPTPEQAQAARDVVASFAGNPADQLNNGQIQRKKIAENVLGIVDNPPPARDFEIQVCAIGDLAIVALPAEMFVEFGLEIKRKSPFAFTIVNELSNGSGNGYVCTSAAYGRGGYEPSGHRFAVGAGEAFVQAAIELLEELYGR